MRKIIAGLLLTVFSLSASEVYATFNVEAVQSANLAFISSGIVEKIEVDIGSVVKAKDVLATLENSDLKAMLESSEITLKYAKKDYERQVKIKNLIDEGKFDGFEYKYENAKSQLMYQGALYEKTFLKAPFEGVIYDKDIEIGDAVSGMMLKTVFKIQSLKKRKLVLDFDQKNYKIIKVGQTFKYTIDGDEKVYAGTISKIYPYANSANRKIQAEVTAENFMVGLFGSGYILTADTK